MIVGVESREKSREHAGEHASIAALTRCLCAISTYGFGGRGGGLRPDPPLGGRWGGAFFSGVPQLLGGFGGAGSTSSVSVPRMGMGGGEPSLSAGKAGISFMSTEMGRSPGYGYRCGMSSLLCYKLEN